MEGSAPSQGQKQELWKRVELVVGGLKDMTTHYFRKGRTSGTLSGKNNSKSGGKLEGRFSTQEKEREKTTQTVRKITARGGSTRGSVGLNEGGGGRQQRRATGSKLRRLRSNDLVQKFGKLKEHKIRFGRECSDVPKHCFKGIVRGLLNRSGRKAPGLLNWFP